MLTYADVQNAGGSKYPDTTAATSNKYSELLESSRKELRENNFSSNTFSSTTFAAKDTRPSTQPGGGGGGGASGGCFSAVAAQSERSERTTSERTPSLSGGGTKFTCFTSTLVQILTQRGLVGAAQGYALRPQASDW